MGIIDCAGTGEIRAGFHIFNLKLLLEGWNIQLLAENHINLVDKLNQAIHAQDKSLLYEVQVSGLKARVEQLEREVKDINSRIA